MKKYSKDDLEAIKRCKEKWIELTNNNQSTHKVVKSCNKDITKYLIPIGTMNELSYYGKPENSYRFSDHWNWYSNLNKCTDENYIQCYSDNIPGPYDRKEYGKASEPVFAISICRFENGIYKVIFGDCYDFQEKKWVWVE